MSHLGPPVPHEQEPGATPPYPEWPPPAGGQPPVPGAFPPPPGAGVPPGPFYVTPQPPSKLRKWGGLAGGVVMAGVVGASWLGFGGPGDPEVGDCVAATGESSWEKVGCDDARAEARVVGIEEERQTEEEFMADEDTCAQFPTAVMFLWSGAIGQTGSVLCAEPVLPSR